MGRQNEDSGDEEEIDYSDMGPKPAGAPEGFYDGLEKGDTDPRLPERYVKRRSNASQDIDNSLVPIQQLSASLIPSSHLQDYGITREEAAFMQAVVKAMNGELRGYELVESMREIRTQYDVREEKLVQRGYLKRHTGVARRSYYTVTFDGQEACRVDKKQGRGYGDIGADTPHRVGMALAKRYYNSLDHVRRVEMAVRVDGQKSDLLVIDQDHTRIAIVEVESGRISADPDVSDDDRSGTNNYDAVRADYRLLADSDGESVWVVRNYEIAGVVLRALTSCDTIPFELPKTVIRSVSDGSKKIGDLNQNDLGPQQDDGIDEVVTFRQLRNRLREMD